MRWEVVDAPEVPPGPDGYYHDVQSFLRGLRGAMLNEFTRERRAILMPQDDPMLAVLTVVLYYEDETHHEHFRTFKIKWSAVQHSDLADRDMFEEFHRDLVSNYEAAQRKLDDVFREVWRHPPGGMA